MRMRFLKMILAYDGTDFSGWQVQPRMRTVQGVMQQAWQRITGEPATWVASGRTDAGVHALGQACSVASESRLEPRILLKALNAYAPRDIRVESVEEMEGDFHAIRDAVAKTYRYQIQLGVWANPFFRRHAWHVREALDLSAMRDAAARIVGRRDFASFQAAGSRRVSTVRHIQRLDVQRVELDGQALLRIEVRADGFLYNMVRNLVGTLVMVGRGERPPEWLDALLAAHDRRLAGPTAPPQGLFLVRVDFEPRGGPQPGDCL